MVDQKHAMPVAQAIRDLRMQLLQLEEEARSEALKFKVRSIEFELNLVLTTEVTADAKLGWGILSIGGGAKSNDSTTHKLKLCLDLTGPGGQAPEIAGPEQARPSTGPWEP